MSKILIVEDEASFSEALAFLLGKEGFRPWWPKMAAKPLKSLPRRVLT